MFLEILSALGGPVTGMIGAVASSFIANKHEENKINAESKAVEAKTKMIEVVGKTEHSIKLLEIMQTKQDSEFNDIGNSRDNENRMLSKLAENSLILAWNGAVRPGIATSIFILYLFAKMTLIYNGYNAEISLRELAVIIFSNQDYHIMSLIISFYFTARQLNKINNRQKNK